MKKFYIVIASILTIVSIANKSFAEGEPNNSYSQANSITVQGSETGTLSSGDEDWFAVTIPDDGSLTFTFSGAGDLQANNLSLHASNGDAITSGSYGTSCSVSYSNLAQGTYYIKIPYYSGSTNTYSISNSFVPAGLPSDNESITEISAATAITLNGSTTGRLYYRTINNFDVTDYYKVTIPDDGYLQIHVSCESTLQVNNLLIFDKDATTQIASGSYGTVADVAYANLSPGTYYIAVNHWSGYGSYTISNTFTPALYTNDTEPNDDASNAQELLINDSLTARMNYKNLSYNDLTDWFKVTLPDNGRITVSVECEATLQVNNIAIYDVNQTSQLSVGSYGNTASVTSNNLLAGTYYIKVPHWSGYGSYIIRNSFAVADLTNDTEPNNYISFAQSFGLNDSVTGQLYYQQNGVYDVTDWFTVTIPDDGQLSFFVQCESTLQVNNLLIYDKDTITQITSGSYGNTASVGYANLTAGTYYIKVPHWSGYGSYVLKNEFIPATYVSDSYSNEIIQDAQVLSLNDSITGRLYYRNIGNYDVSDWYKVTVPDDGQLSFSVQCEPTLQVNNLLIFDKDTATQIASGSYGVTAGVSFVNLTEGTYYIKVPHWSGYGSYVLKNEFIAATYASDSDTNDIIENAQIVNLNDSITGRINYRNKSSYDVSDWYKVTIPDDGQLSFTVQCEPTLQVNNLLIFDKDTATQIASGSYGVTAGVSFANLTPGTYYVKVPHWSGYGSYILKNQFTPATLASDSIWNNDINHAQQIYVNDSITGRLYYRNKGVYDTQDWYMIVLPKTGNLNISVYTTDGLQVDNLRIYHKNKSSQLASGSYGYTGSVSLNRTFEDTLYVYIPYWAGYGSYVLKANYLPAPTAEFTLYQDLYDIATVNTSVLADTYSWDFGDGNSSTDASARHTYNTPGTFSIQMIASNAAGSDTTTQVIEIEGIRDFIPHTGGNAGDVTISIYGGGFREDSRLWIEKDGVQFNPDTTMLVERGVLRGMFNLRGIAAGVYDVCVRLQNGTILRQNASFTVEEGGHAEPWVNIVGRDRILFNRWQTYSISYGNTGKVDATGVPLWILLPRGPGIEIDFSALHMSIPETEDTVWQYMLDSLPVYMDVETYKGEPFSGRLYPLFIPSIPAGETFTLRFRIKTPSNIEMYAWVSPPYFQSPVNPDVASCIRWAQMKAIANGLVNVINEQLPGVACASSVMQSIYGLTYGDPQPISSHLWAISRSTFTCAAEFLGPLKAYKLSVAVIEMGLDIYENYDADNECRKPKPDPNNPDKEKKGPFNDEPQQRNRIRAVSSFDPNEIIGPRGYTQNNYVPKGIDYTYSIYFENKDTATAPATEVVVIDTLDKNIFDISTFNLNYVNFGDTTIYVPHGGYEFTTDVDLRPQLPSIVRISAVLDTATGIATWRYITLDTVNYEINEDPFAGFLPPNVNKPEGEGIVNFTIQLKENVTEGTPITNKATIFFDANPPISTNTYSNVIDETLPLSTISGPAIVSDDSSPVIPISWSGNDDESGISAYTILVSKNDDTFETLLGNTTLTSYDFIAEPGNNYKFLCIAADSAGNREPLTKSYDYSIEVPISVDKPIIEQETFTVSPNPVITNATIEYTTTKRSTVTISIISNTGVVMYEQTEKRQSIGKHIEIIDISKIPNGIYTVTVSSENQTRSKKIVKISL